LDPDLAGSKMSRSGLPDLKIVDPVHP